MVDSAPASPLAPPAVVPVTDASVEASPTSGIPHAAYVPAHTAIAVRLRHAIDSAHVRNGDMVEATLNAPLRLSNGKMLVAGSPVGLTVVAAAAAGRLQSAGEITLQVTHVGVVDVLSDALTFFGHEGHKDIADSAPQKGTEASVAADAMLTFHVPAVPG